MGVSVDRGMGVCFQTNNGDRSALAGKYYSGCLCWLFIQMHRNSKSCPSQRKKSCIAKLFILSPARVPGYLLLKKAPCLLIVHIAPCAADYHAAS